MTLTKQPLRLGLGLMAVLGVGLGLYFLLGPGSGKAAT
jgi:hypothetical protein